MTEPDFDTLTERLDRLERRIRGLAKRLKTVHQLVQAAARPPETVLGHMHAAPEAQLQLSSWGDYWEPSNPHPGPVESPAVTCWQIADLAGKLVQTIPVDMGRVETEITESVKELRDTWPKDWGEEGLPKQESYRRRGLWVGNALKAARTVFPVCHLRCTYCGYDIVL